MSKYTRADSKHSRQRWANTTEPALALRLLVLPTRGFDAAINKGSLSGTALSQRRIQEDSALMPS